MVDVALAGWLLYTFSPAVSTAANSTTSVNTSSLSRGYCLVPCRFQGSMDACRAATPRSPPAFPPFLYGLQVHGPCLLAHAFCDGLFKQSGIDSSTSATAHRPQCEPECNEFLDGPASTRQARRHGRRQYGLLSPSISSAASQRMSKEARTTVSRCVEAIRCREVFALPRNDPRLSAAIVGSDTQPNKRAVAWLRFGCRRSQRESSTRCLAWHYLLCCVAR